MENGIYYIVLADLVGSEREAAKSGNSVWAAWTRAFANAAENGLAWAKCKANSGQFVKRVGDAVLLLFQKFPDALDWYLEFSGALLLSREGKPMRARVVVHVGEVHFDESDPQCLAVSHVFKMEKKARAGEMLLSETAFRVAHPAIYPKQFTFIQRDVVELPGYEEPLKLYKLVEKSAMAFLIEKTAHGSRETQQT